MLQSASIAQLDPWQTGCPINPPRVKLTALRVVLMSVRNVLSLFPAALLLLFPLIHVAKLDLGTQTTFVITTICFILENGVFLALRVAFLTN